MSSNDPASIARLWIAQLDERLAWLDSQIDDAEISVLVPLVDALSERHKRLGDYLKMIQSEVAHRMISREVEAGAIDGWDDMTLHVEAVRRPRRTAIQRDDLVAAVDRAALMDEHRIDTQTGEVIDVSEARLRLTRQAFRLEPRWSELRKLGIESDEYATTEWTETIDIKRVKEL